jgi:hypothetical protein
MKRASACAIILVLACVVVSNLGLVCPESEVNPTKYLSLEMECSSVIVTGTAAKDGRAILMKNRDWASDRAHRPIYHPATSSTYAVVAVNEFTMGINERGLAVMNTAMPSLEPDPAYGNLPLNRKILETCESVEEVARRLNDSRDEIGPVYRSALGTVATCVGVVDRFGEGAFFEISNDHAYVEYVVDGYSTRANTPRIFGGISRPAGGRDLYLLNALDNIYAEQGVISWQDVMQRASRYVRDKELGTQAFPIDGEACNPSTVAAMVAVSGDSRYDGRLNCMWSACGPNPLVGVFLPSMVLVGEPPAVQAGLWSETYQKWLSASVTNPIEQLMVDPYRVREVQDVTFYTENYTCGEYDHLLAFVQEGLSDWQLQTVVDEYVNRVVQYAADVYVTEDISMEVPERVDHTFPVTTTPTTETSTSAQTSLTDSTGPDTISEAYAEFLAGYVQLGVGLLLGVTVVLLAARRKGFA